MIRTTDPQLKIRWAICANNTVFSVIIIISLPVHENDLMVCSIIEQNTKISYMEQKKVNNL